jgi:hypothetical protein
LELMSHLGIKPRTIAIGQSHQNGDVEASSGALKRRLEQHLLLRGSRSFATPGRVRGLAWRRPRTGQPPAFRAVG